MKIDVRFYVAGKQVRRERLEVEPPQLAALAEEHSQFMFMVAGQRPWLVSVELLDDPDDPNRFTRFGTDVEGMRDPRIFRS